ncbi:unnamed protein product [Paramecium octaurelia]|uniref:Uncharacterized protein n=1 Tax=Paramecium octaurelia TaxID=43137 RepID=A0A8S1TAB2_PAROT|nr:unnamed protein product [Paramecium octaurelia]
MGSAACKKEEIEIKNLYQLYHRVSKQNLPDQISSELHSVRTRLIKDKIPKASQILYNILLNNIQEESILETQRLKFQKEQQLNCSKIQNDCQLYKSQSLFFRSFRFYNFEELRNYIVNDEYKNNTFIFEILNLFNTTDIYCQKVKLFLSRINSKYYMLFYSLLWNQYKLNINVLSSIFPFEFMNDGRCQKIPFDFTFQQFMYKIWGNNIQPRLNKHQIYDLLHSKNNKELIQYFKDFIEISTNEYQLTYLGNVGLTYSNGFQDFLNQLIELLNEEFDRSFYNKVEAILKYVKENRFLNQLLNEQVLIYYIYPSVFKYIETQLSLILKEQFKVTKKYLKDQIIQDKVQSNTLSKLLLEENEQNYTKISNTLSSQCKTNYTSSLKADYLSVQNQDETTFFNFEKNKWEYFADVQQSSCLNMIELSNQVDEAKLIIEKRSNHIFKIFNLENPKQQEFAIQYVNIMFNYTHINNKEDISELLLQLSLFY